MNISRNGDRYKNENVGPRPDKKATLRSRRHRKKTLNILVAGLFLTGAVICHASADPFLDGEIKKIETSISEWRRISHNLALLTYLAAALGIIVASVQAMKSKWLKGAAAVLAVTSTLILGYIHQCYPADDRAYDKAARLTDRKLTGFRLELQQYEGKDLDQAARQDFYGKFAELLNQLDQIRGSTLDGPRIGMSGPSLEYFSLISSAWAGQPGPPNWVAQLPNDGQNLYFQGVAEAITLELARKASLENAQAAASVAIARGANTSLAVANKPKLVADLAKALTAATEVAETFSLPQPGGKIRAYTLLRLSKGTAGFTARSIFVQNGIPYDNKFLQTFSPQ
jgi:hypothetical protein